MIRAGLSVALAALCLTAVADVPGDYAWGWPLQTEGDAAAWRIRLEPPIVERLSNPQARDLAVFDAEGRSMPLLRVPPGRLVEVSTFTRELRFETRGHRDHSRRPGGGVASDDVHLSLLIVRPDGTRVELRAPESDPAQRDAEIVYEALIEGPTRADSGEDGHLLVTEWAADQPLEDALDCVLKSVDRAGAHGVSLEFQTAFDTRPATMIARSRVAPDTRGWHVSCRATALPAGLALERARIESRRTVDHARQVEIPLPAANPEPGVLEGQIDHPFALSRLRVSSTARNQLSAVQLLLRRGPDERWRRHGATELSNLGRPPSPRRHGDPPESAPGIPAVGQAVFDLDRQPLRRLEWRVESTPPIAEPVEVVLEARVEEWLFLAQGQPPWRLHAGSRQAMPSNPDLFVESTLSRLGPAWELPLAELGERFEAGGAAALQTPRKPLPWGRWLLWLILIGGSLTVSWMALRLLRSSA